MKIHIKSLFLLLTACCAFNLHAYTFKFKNYLKVPVTVSLHLVAKGDYDTKVIPAAQGNTPGEGSFDFGGIYIWFCLDTNTMRFAKEEDVLKGQPLKEQPVVFTSQRVCDQIVDEMLKYGKTSYALGTPRHTTASECRSQEFDIVVDRDGKVCVIMVHEFY